MRASALILVFLAAFGVGGRAGAQTWARFYGGPGADKVSCALETADGGYVLAGYTDSFGAGERDLWVLKLDAAGSLQWQRAYGGPEHDVALSIGELPGGGYVVAGSTWSFGDGWSEAWVLRLDASGGDLWRRTYGGPGADSGQWIEVTAEGRLFVAATFQTESPTAYNPWLFEVDGSGAILSQWTLSAPAGARFSTVRQTPSGFVALGHFLGTERGPTLLRLDPSGTPLGMRTYRHDPVDGSSWSGASGLAPTADGGAVLVGSLGWRDWTGFSDAWVLKLDSLGEVEWFRRLSAAVYDNAKAVAQTPDGGYAVAGWFEGIDPSPDTGWLLRLDALGDLLWEREYAHPLHLVRPAPDGGFLLVGTYEPVQAGSPDVLVLKTDGQGRIASDCAPERDLAPSVSSGAVGYLNEAVVLAGFGGAGSASGAVVTDTGARSLEPGGDRFEEDDVCPSLTFLQEGVGQDHFFCDDPEDWAWFHGCVGATYTIETSGLGPLTDTVLDLYGPDCFTLLASDDNGAGGLASRIAWTPTEDGRYHVRTGQADASAGGGRGYRLTFARSGPGCETWARLYELDTPTLGGRAAVPTSEGGYAAAGSLGGFMGAQLGGFLLNLDSSGALQWQKAYGGSEAESVEAFLETRDGGYALAGETGWGSPKAWVVRLDASGGILWQKAFTRGAALYAKDIIETSDGGFILVALTLPGDLDYYLSVLKLDGSGNLQWAGGYPADFHVDPDYAALENGDGDFLVAGRLMGGAGLLKIDAAGNLLWQKRVGGEGERLHSLDETPDGGYVLTGAHLPEAPLGPADLSVIRLDAGGRLLWRRVYASKGDEEGHDVRTTADGGFVVAGTHSSIDRATQAAWLLKRVWFSCWTFLAQSGTRDSENSVR